MPYLQNDKDLAAFVARCLKSGFCINDLVEDESWPDYPAAACVAVQNGIAVCYRYKERLAVGLVLPEGYVEAGTVLEDCREAFKVPGAVTAKRNGQISKVPCVVGQLVWITSREFSCFGRAVTVDESGCVLTLRKFNGDVIAAAADTKAARYCSAVPIGLTQGAAALMMQGRFEGVGYYYLAAPATQLEAKVTGWKRTKSGKIMLAGSLPRYALAENHVRVKKAMREGLQEPREWLDTEIAQIAAVEVLSSGLRASDAFLRWFKIEWEDGRRATWEHANVFEAFVKKHEKR